MILMFSIAVSVGLNCFRIHVQLNTSIVSETFPAFSSSISEVRRMPAHMTSWTHSVFPVRHLKFNQASCVYLLVFPPRESTTMLVTGLLVTDPCLLIIWSIVPCTVDKINVQLTEKFYKSLIEPKFWWHARKKISMDWENAPENGNFAYPCMHLESKEKYKERTWNLLVLD